MYGTGKILREIKVYSVIKNAPVSLVVLLMIKAILLQEALILRFTYGMEIILRLLWVVMLVASLEPYNMQMVNFIQVVKMVTSA